MVATIITTLLNPRTHRRHSTELPHHCLHNTRPMAEIDDDSKEERKERNTCSIISYYPILIDNEKGFWF